MPAKLGNDELGPTLFVECDRCSEPIMAFGFEGDNRQKLEAIIRRENWQQKGNDYWICPICQANSSANQNSEPPNLM